MRVLIVGGGGREHAIAVSMKKSSRLDALYCVPGNAGIAQIAECEPSIGVMEFDRIVSYAKEKEIDLVFVAPDDPLAAGLVDVLEEAGFRVFGPKKFSTRRKRRQRIWSMPPCPSSSRPTGWPWERAC